MWARSTDLDAVLTTEPVDHGPGTATGREITDARRNREVEDFAPTDHFRLQLQHMQDCLDSGTPHRIPPADSISQMGVIDAVYASLSTGTPTRVACE